MERLAQLALAALTLAALGSPGCSSPAPASPQPELAAPATELEIVAQPTVSALVASPAPSAAPTPAVATSPDAPRPPPAFTLRWSTAKAGDPIEVLYAEPVIAPEGQQYWITIIPAGAHDGEYGEWHYVEQGATNDKLPTTTAGTFEIRLHDLYPEHETKVLQRKIVKVK